MKLSRTLESLKLGLISLEAWIPSKAKPDFLVTSGLIVVSAFSGWMVGQGGDFAENYFSAEQTQKRIELKEQEAAKILATEQEQAAADAIQKAEQEAELAVQRAAGEERITPEIKEQLFARANLAKAACYPHGYGFEARVDAENRITYFQENTVFDRDDYRKSWTNSDLVEECLENINLAPYWENANLPESPTSAHMDVMQDIYVMCGTGVKEEESVLAKDGVMTYQFSIAAERVNATEYDDYMAYWNCVNDSSASPVFQHG